MYRQLPESSAVTLRSQMTCVLEVAGISFEDAVADRQAASDDHNRRETALYAQSLERKALARN